MARRHKGNVINAWLALDKDEGPTSTEALGMVKRIVNPQKAGHGGTLDPLATGILPIAFGEATKTVAHVMDAAKTYRFTVRFGEARDTDDVQGAVTATRAARPSDAALKAALPAYIGLIEQRPPSYAAIKVNGERAYDAARRGGALELAARPVRIDSLELVERPDADHAVFEAVCGKGTYVRAIARDLGEALGCLGCVSRLRRTAVGRFTAANAVTIDALRRIVDDDTLPQVLVPLATALADIPAFAVTGPQARRLRSGGAIRVPPALLEASGASDGPLRAMHDGEVVALLANGEDGLRPLRVFNIQHTV